MSKSQRVLEIILFFCIFIIYIHSISQSIFAGDSGLLTSAAFVHGVAHPSGYPLLTILGFLVTRLSLITSLSPAFLMGVLSAVLSAFGIVLYFRLAFRFTANLLIAVISSLMLASVYIFWLQATVPEVFALNNYFVLLLIYLADQVNKTKSQRIFFIFVFFAGLSLTNHFTILFLFPGLLLFIWPSVRTKSKSTLLKSSGIFLAGLLPYLYVVFVSLSHPVIDWANITNFKSFMEFVLRVRYGTFKAGYFDTPGVSNRISSLLNYLELLLRYLTLPSLFLSLIGVFIEVIKRKRRGIALLVTFLFSGPIFFFYAGFPFDMVFYATIAERFMTMSLIILLLFLPIGIFEFSNRLGKFFSRPLYTILFAGIFILIPLQLFIANYSLLNFSHVTIGNLLGKNYLTPLPKDSILLIGSDTSLFTTMYMHYVEHVRSDVTVLNAQDPQSINQALVHKDSSLSTPADSIAAQAALLKNIELIDSLYPVFSEVPYNGNPAISWVPFGIVYELRTSKEPKLSENEFLTRDKNIFDSLAIPIFHDLAADGSRNASLAGIYNTYSWAFWHTAVYISKTYSNPQPYAEYMLRSIKAYPDFALGYASLGSYALSIENNCASAILNFNQAIEKDTSNKKYYQLLANTQEECHTNKGERDVLKLRYRALFHQDLK